MSKHLVRMWFSVPIDVFDAITDTAERVAGKPLPFWAAGALVAGVERDRKLTGGRRAARELVEDYESEFGPIPKESWQKADRFIAETLRADPEDEKILESLLSGIPKDMASGVRRVWIAVRPEIADRIREVARQAGQSTSAWATEVLFTKSRLENCIADGSRDRQRSVARGAYADRFDMYE